MEWGMRWNLLIGLPAAIGLGLLAGPIITTLFHYGQFTSHDVWMTRQSVIAYAIGLQAFMLAKLLATGFYSCQDIQTPVRYSMVTVIANLTLNGLLIMPFAHAGLALATALSSWLNVGLLYGGLHRRGLYQLQSGWGKFMMQLLTANGALAAFLWWQHAPLSVWLHSAITARLSHLCALMGLAVLVYFATLRFTGIRLKALLAMPN
jgi:putative peptidoglycan lipid II flippase